MFSPGIVMPGPVWCIPSTGCTKSETFWILKCIWCQGFQITGCKSLLKKRDLLWITQSNGENTAVIRVHFPVMPFLMEDSVSSRCWAHAHLHDWLSLANGKWAEEVSHFRAKLEEATDNSPFSLSLLPRAHQCCSGRLRSISLGAQWRLAHSGGRTYHLETEWERERNLHGWSLWGVTQSVSTDMNRISAFRDRAVRSCNICGQWPLMTNSQHPAGIPGSALWMNGEGDTESGPVCHAAVLTPQPPPQCWFPYVDPKPNFCWLNVSQHIGH